MKLARSQLGNLTYTYDADRRVTSKGGAFASMILPQSVSGNAFNADNEMTSFGSQALSYDANGNLVADGTNTYAWDARNHMSGLGGAISASFLYDGLGRRASKTVNGTTTQFLYDRLNPVQELSAGNPPGSVTANLLTGLAVDEYFSRTDPNGEMSFLRDALGSTNALTNSAGALNTQYTYQPFGTTTATGPTNANPYQFTGRESDGTGLYYYRARYYSPRYQRFIVQDPIGLEMGPNLYSYTYNDPISLDDPSGLYTFSFGFSFSGGVNGLGGMGFGGIAIDGNGNIGLYWGGGIGMSTPGVWGSGGFSVAGSNACTVGELAGPFANFSGGGGFGADLSGDVFAGGGIVGAGVTYGAGVGVGGVDVVTGTHVEPLTNLFFLLGLL
jgi:RHS repeat-associated protein